MRSFTSLTNGKAPYFLASASFIVLITSKYNGSPALPASFVLSSTAIFLTVLGSSFKKYLELNGLYKWTSNKPTDSFLNLVKYSTVSFTVSQTEPIATITLVAVGLP